MFEGVGGGVIVNESDSSFVGDVDNDGDVVDDTDRTLVADHDLLALLLGVRDTVSDVVPEKVLSCVQL